MKGFDMRMFLLGALITAVLGTAGRARAEGDGDEVKVGDPAPSFTLPLYNAEAQQRPMFSLDSFVGADADEPNVKVLLMSFFATFCAPCKREMPYLEQLQEQYRGQGLRVVMISIDREDEAVEKIEALAKQNHISFPILKDRFNFLARRYLGETAPLPSVFIVGRDGMVKELSRGYGKDASTFLLGSVQKALGIAGVAKAAK
jgi:thiol-disulfide isomerase/thioredoxin